MIYASAAVDAFAPRNNPTVVTVMVHDRLRRLWCLKCTIYAYRLVELSCSLLDVDFFLKEP